jgi:hypothetical protein
VLPVHLERDRITLGRLAVTLHRTLRIPDDGRDYPLPPSLGGFPALRAGRDQDYLGVPPQPWLDGIKTGPERVRQFVAMTFSEAIPAPPAGALGAGMGLAAGGAMRQKVYPDPHGPEAWDPGRTARLYVHIVNSQMFREITGRPAPESPVSARTYTEHGLPWFGLYDEHLGDVPAPDVLGRVRSVREMDADRGFAPQQDDRPVAVPDEQVRRQAPAGDPGAVADDAW